jgi:hypothetical protein
VDAALRDVTPRDRYFDNSVAQAFGDSERLDVICETVHARAGENVTSYRTLKQLEAALRISKLGQLEATNHPIEELSHPLAVDGESAERAGLGKASGAAGDTITLFDPLLELGKFLDGDREIRVGNEHELSLAFRDTGPDRCTLSLIGRKTHDAKLWFRSTLHDLNGLIQTSIVDDEDLKRPPT